MKTWMLLSACLLLTGISSAEGAPQQNGTPTAAANSGAAEEVYGCMCVPKDECKDDTVDAKERPPEVGAKNECGPEQVCCFHLIVRTEKTVETHSYLFPLPEVQNALAQKGEFPWQRYTPCHCKMINQQARITNRPLAACQQYCRRRSSMVYELTEGFESSTEGPFIIGPKNILSTADCVHKFQGEKASKLFVRLGVLDRSILENSPVHQNYTVDKVIVHPKFRSAQIRNVAVLQLREEVATTPTIGRVVLAKPEDGSFAAKHCVISGWGKNLKRGSLSSVLTKANVSIVERTPCQAALRKTRLGPSFKLDEGSMCVAGEGGAAACQGDDGGPLVCKRSSEDRPVLVGLVSYGDLPCGQLGVPAVYADVAKNMAFITEATGLPRERFTKA
ncbi:phenoloxidase-activating factor 2-like [Dermacentor silvarum]|uniref:phenoloxidase-activating factor 2-like n=1 Tax=Dermacentor silvarum TaxID=543639 RepID=UPI0021007C8B|nr:phenoloxidase-activating factor 2-like [Dermacentor silvarum]